MRTINISLIALLFTTACGLKSESTEQAVQVEVKNDAGEGGNLFFWKAVDDKTGVLLICRRFLSDETISEKTGENSSDSKKKSNAKQTSKDKEDSKKKNKEEEIVEPLIEVLPEAEPEAPSDATVCVDAAKLHERLKSRYESDLQNLRHKEEVFEALSQENDKQSSEGEVSLYDLKESAAELEKVIAFTKEHKLAAFDSVLKKLNDQSPLSLLDETTDQEMYYINVLIKEFKIMSAGPANGIALPHSNDTATSSSNTSSTLSPLAPRIPSIEAEPLLISTGTQELLLPAPKVQLMESEKIQRIENVSGRTGEPLRALQPPAEVSRNLRDTELVLPVRKSQKSN